MNCQVILFFSEHKTLWCLSVLINVKLFHSLSNYVSEYAHFNRLGIFLIYLLITRSPLASAQRLLCPKFQAGINTALANLMYNEIRAFFAYARVRTRADPLYAQGCVYSFKFAPTKGSVILLVNATSSAGFKYQK